MSGLLAARSTFYKPIVITMRLDGTLPFWGSTSLPPKSSRYPIRANPDTTRGQQVRSVDLQAHSMHPRNRVHFPPLSDTFSKGPPSSARYCSLDDNGLMSRYCRTHRILFAPDTNGRRRSGGEGDRSLREYASVRKSRISSVVFFFFFPTLDRLK